MSITKKLVDPRAGAPRCDKVVDQFLKDFDYYSVTEDGKILTRMPSKGSLPFGTVISLVPWREKYTRVRSDGSRQFHYNGTSLLVHRIVYRAFCGPLKKKPVVHADGNPNNNHYTNLKLSTLAKISAREYLDKPEGRVSNVKISKESIKLIWELRIQGNSLKEISKAVEVSKTQTSYIVSKRSRVRESNEVLADLAKKD